MESGYAAALCAMIDVLVPADASRAGRRHKQVNVLAGSMLTPGDIEHVKELVEAFGLRPVVVPDIADSLDGHLTPEDFSPLTIGGTPVADIAALGESCATLVIGRSLAAAADLLHGRSGVPEYRFDSLMGLDEVDAFVAALSRIADRPVPEKIERQRAQLQDAMVDTHFMFGFARVAIAADPDLLHGLSRLVRGMGGETVAAVAPARAPVLADVAAGQVQIGDLEDLEFAARAAAAQVDVQAPRAIDQGVANLAQFGNHLLVAAADAGGHLDHAAGDLGLHVAGDAPPLHQSHQVGRARREVVVVVVDDLQLELHAQGQVA